MKGLEQSRPFFMFWHVEILFNLALVVYLAARPDGRSRFEAMMVCRLIFDAVQLVCERTGHPAIGTNVWYMGVLFWALLLIPALRESVTYPHRWHREILFAWTALSMMTAWIRFFPYTGRAVLIVDAAAFGCWIAEKMLRREQSSKP